MEFLKRFLFENRSGAQTVLKNTIWLTASNVGARLIKALLIIYAARSLGTAGYGVFSYAVSLAAFFGVFSDGGVSALVTRETAREGHSLKEHFTAALILKLLLLLISALLIIVVAPLFTNIKEAIPLLPLAALLIASDGLRDLCFAITRARERMEQEANITIITNVAITTLGAAALFLHNTPHALLFGYTLGSLAGLLGGLWILRNTLRNIWGKPTLALMGTMLREGWQFAVMGLMGTIMVNTDAIILGAFGNAAQVGLYSAAQRPVLLLYLIPTIMSTSIFPRLVRLAGEKERFRGALESSLAASFLFALPLFAGGAVLARGLVGLLFGAEYIPATLTFGVMLFTLILSFPETIISNAVFAKNAQCGFIGIALTGVFANALLDILLIPHYGIAGAAAATVFTQSITTVLLWYKMKRVASFSVLPRLKIMTTATILMTVIVFGTYKLHTPVALSMFLGIVTYIAALILLKEPLLEEFKNAFRLS